MDGHVHKEEAPWWNFLIEDLSITIGELLNKLPSIPLPDIKVPSSGILSDSDINKDDTFKGVYGDFQSWWCFKMQDCIIQWCLRRRKTSSINVDLDDIPKRMIPWTGEDRECKFEGEALENYKNFLKARSAQRDLTRERKYWKDKTVKSIRNQHEY